MAIHYLISRSPQKETTKQLWQLPQVVVTHPHLWSHRLIAKTCSVSQCSVIQGFFKKPPQKKRTATKRSEQTTTRGPAQKNKPKLRNSLSTCCQLLGTSWCIHPLVQGAGDAAMHAWKALRQINWKIKTIEVSFVDISESSYQESMGF